MRLKSEKKPQHFVNASLSLIQIPKLCGFTMYLCMYIVRTHMERRVRSIHTYVHSISYIIVLAHSNVYYLPRTRYEVQVLCTIYYLLSTTRYLLVPRTRYKVCFAERLTSTSYFYVLCVYLVYASSVDRLR